MSTWTQISEQLEIEGMDPYPITIVGVTPLLCHNPMGTMLLQATRGNGKSPKRGSEADPPSPDEEAHAGAYRDDHGRYAFPGDAVRHALVAAAAAYKAGKSSLKTRMAHVIAVPVMVPILDPDTGEPVSGYAIDMRRVVIHANKSAVVRARPRFDRWMLKLSILADHSILGVRNREEAAEILARVLNDAGMRIGLGDYRPAKGGPFGRFRVAAES